MPRQQAADQSLDDVQVLGVWNFTLQGDTPLYWLRTGQLDRYLMSLRITSPCPSTCGLVLHAEVDGPGTDGASFWIERRPPKDGKEGTRRYMLAGEGLESKPIVTRAFPDKGGELNEDIEVLMEGYQGTIFLQERKVQLRFRTKHSKGSLAFYNSTQGDNDDVHFAGVRITALRRGPLEVGGKMLDRERALDRFAAEDRLEAGEADYRGTVRRSPKGSTFGAFGSSTQAPDSMQTRMASTMALGGGNSDLRRTVSGRTQLPSPMGSGGRSPMQLGGRGTATKGRLSLSASDGALRKTTGSFFGGGGGSNITSPGGVRQKRTQGLKSTGDRWVPLAVNAPAGEQQLLQSISRPAPSSRACTDFIAM